MSINERTSVRGTAVTDANIAELEPLLRPYRVRVGVGLYLEVTPDERKVFLASWLCPRANRSKSKRLGEWGEALTIAAARQLADELRAEARSTEPPRTKPVKDSAEYQRDKRLRQAARRETVKNLTFHKRFLSWPAP
jgi:hypothetical protein